MTKTEITPESLLRKIESKKTDFQKAMLSYIDDYAKYLKSSKMLDSFKYEDEKLNFAVDVTFEGISNGIDAVVPYEYYSQLDDEDMDYIHDVLRAKYLKEGVSRFLKDIGSKYTMKARSSRAPRRTNKSGIRVDARKMF